MFTVEKLPDELHVITNPKVAESVIVVRNREETVFAHRVSLN